MNDTFALVVLGMHRSGTSALTGSLGLLGVALGDEMRAPHEGVNAKGYWEHLGILRVHERLLEHLRSSWDDVRPLPEGWWKEPSVTPFRREIVAVLRRDFASSPVWAVKDPRTCRLVPLWLDAFAEVGCRFGFVHTMRSPVEVARSLAKRDGFSFEKSAILWLENNIAAEQATRERPRLFLGFDDLLANPLATLRRIEAELAIRFPRTIDEASQGLGEFLTPQLRSHVASTSSGEGEKNADLIARVQRALDASRLGESGWTRTLWDEVGNEYAKLVASYEPALENHVGDLQSRIAELERRIAGVESSASWQMTRPLRKVGRLVTRALERK